MVGRLAEWRVVVPSRQADLRPQVLGRCKCLEREQVEAREPLATRSAMCQPRVRSDVSPIDGGSSMTERTTSLAMWASTVPRDFDMAPVTV